MNNRNFLKSFFTEYWKYITVSAACKLNVFDILVSGEKTSLEISEDLSIKLENIELLLNGLLAIDFLDRIEGRYLLNNLSELLTDSHSETLKYACLNWSGEHLEAWSKLDESIKTGNSFFENKYKNNYFDFLDRNEEKLDHYHKAMNAYAMDDYKDITDVIDFNIHKSVMDVGGGYGAAISNIKERCSELDCYLFDLDLVIGKSNSGNSVKLLKGDFFVEIPKLSEAIILSRVLHDWNEEKAIQILNNTYQALPENGTLYIIENCSDKIDVDLSLLSLNMLVMCESLERSSYEYIALANQVKFKFMEAKQLNELQTILIFKK
ncbi:methyltransferase [Psychroserpens luteus]|uniref:Methyltransferase n=1 Tax=Psychroserpens luteus TaxID=1434066 RepID=A0ABW5ZQB3_9FLAO|nr:methyltransferase [Psychroserpens luteus]